MERSSSYPNNFWMRETHPGAVKGPFDSMIRMDLRSHQARKLFFPWRGWKRSRLPTRKRPPDSSGNQRRFQCLLRCLLPSCFKTREPSAARHYEHVMSLRSLATAKRLAGYTAMNRWQQCQRHLSKREASNVFTNEPF